MIEVKQTKGIPQRWHIGMAEKGGIFTEKIASVVISVLCPATVEEAHKSKGGMVEGGGWRGLNNTLTSGWLQAKQVRKWHYTWSD